MITVTWERLSNGLPVVNKLLGLPASAMSDETAFSLVAISEEMTLLVQRFERRRLAIINELGTVEIDGQKRLDPEKDQEFRKRFEELVRSEVSLDVNPIPWRQLQEIQTVTIGDLGKIAFLVEGWPASSKTNTE